MEGYFYKRGKTWSCTIDVGIKASTGKRDQATKGGFKTKKEAQAYVAALINELDQGTYVKEANILFKDFVEEWLELYEGTGRVKVSTVRVRKHEYNKLMTYFAHYKMKDISRKIYQNSLSKLKADGLSKNTLEGIHCTGRMIFKKAVELGYIKIDPTQYAIIPKTQQTVEELESETDIPKYLEKEELSCLLKMARENGLLMDVVVFYVLAYTGMRAGEMCALKWKDINFKEQTISITKTYYNPTNNTTEYQLLPPKTKSSKRVIDVDAIVLSELESHRAEQNVIKMKHRKIYHDKDFIFAMTDKNYGYPIYVKKIENRMSRLLKLAKLNEELTPHSLRHTHTSLLAEAKVGLEEIMERLGHADDEITRRVYLHVTKTMKKEASQKFSELMKSL